MATPVQHVLPSQRTGATAAVVVTAVPAAAASHDSSAGVSAVPAPMRTASASVSVTPARRWLQQASSVSLRRRKHVPSRLSRRAAAPPVDTSSGTSMSPPLSGPHTTGRSVTAAATTGRSNPLPKPRRRSSHRSKAEQEDASPFFKSVLPSSFNKMSRFHLFASEIVRAARTWMLSPQRACF